MRAHVRAGEPVYLYGKDVSLHTCLRLVRINAVHSYCNPMYFFQFFVVCLFVTKRSKAFGRSLHGIAMHRGIIHVNKFESKTLVDNIECLCQ